MLRDANTLNLSDSESYFILSYTTTSFILTFSLTELLKNHIIFFNKLFQEQKMTINAKATTFTFGTTGNDIINAQYLLGDLIDGLAGDDTITGLDGNDTLIGGTGKDTLSGLGGNDLLDGGSGNDRLFGGSGDDLLRPDNGLIGADYIDGGDGLDTVDYGLSGATRGIRVDLRIVTAQDTRGAGRDTIVNIENVTGTRFNDTLIGSSAANILSGGEGSDNLDGGDGHDVIEGGSGNDNLKGGIGNDRIAPDNGGTGNDVVNGGIGIDTVDYRNLTGTQGVQLDLRLTGAQDTKGAGIDTILNIEQIYGSNYNDTIIGTNGDNWMHASKGSDSLFGSDGNDSLFSDPVDNAGDNLDGGSGNDILRGGFGNDTLSGGLGDDRLTGSWGSDQLSGGAGVDLFTFSGEYDSSVAAPDVILDFNGAEDTISLQSWNITATRAFIGTSAFTGTGITEIRVTSDGVTQLVEVDHDGNGSGDVDMAIKVVGTALTLEDFIFAN